jgi:hypothetical protein
MKINLAVIFQNMFLAVVPHAPLLIWECISGFSRIYPELASGLRKVKEYSFAKRVSF